MDTPASAARRILLGTGLGLAIISGLLFSIGFLPPETCNSNDSGCIPTNSFGWLIPAFSLFFILAGILMWIKPNLLGEYLPNLNQEARLKYKQDQFNQEKLEDLNSNDAWANLEKNLLTRKIEEE